MKRFDIKVDKSSDYWCDFEGELCVYYNYTWNEESFLNDRINFIKKYIELTEKYKIAVPINSFDVLDLEITSLYRLYEKDSNYYFPSYLFLNSNDKVAQKIVSIDPLITLENSKTKFSSHGSIPIRIELIMREYETELICYIDNDIFNLWIDNKKTKRDPNIGSKGFWVDNSELAYLNTPRLNSFLRDLKKLCFDYGANKFEFENLGLNDFSENGVLFDGEVIYYEDIVGLLLPHQKIVK